MNKIIIVVCLLSFSCSLSYSKEYHKKDEILQDIFKNSESIKTEVVKINKKKRRSIKKRYGYKINPEHIFYIAKSDTGVDEYATVVGEMGKHGIITFMIVIGSKGVIRKVAVLENNEIKGKRITEGRFLRQFKGKSLQDSIKVRRDIYAVTGATISSNAVTRAVKKALIVWNEFMENENE